jgi:hypothetical protein
MTNLECGGKAKRRHRFLERVLTTERYQLSESAVDAALCRRSPNGHTTNTIVTDFFTSPE